jgi:hypothetical protein
LHNKILHQCEFCQAHCVELPKRSPTEFSLPSLDIPTSFTKFESLSCFLGIKRNRKQIPGWHNTGPRFQPEAVGRRLGPATKLARPAQQGGTRQLDAWAGRRVHRRAVTATTAGAGVVVSALLVLGLCRRCKLERVSRRALGKASSRGVHLRGMSVARGRSSGSEGASSGAHWSSGWSQLRLGTGGSLLRLRNTWCRQGRTTVRTPTASSARREADGGR